jgi:hypothetical protein
VFGSTVLRIFGPEGVGVTGGWKKFHSDELYNSHSSSNIIRLMKLRRKRWAGHVPRIGHT